MGFFGRIRKWVAGASKNGKVDIAAASKSLVEDAKTSVKGADISAFFSTKYMRDLDGVAAIGKQNLNDFIKWTRVGDYDRSFAVAFRDNPSLRQIPVRNTVNSLLLESRLTLPDFQIQRGVRLFETAKTATSLDTKIVRNAEQLESAVSKNSKLATGVKALYKRVNVTKTLKFLGWTAVITGAGVITYQTIYKKLEELAADQTGCFAYWQSSGSVLRRCKVSSYSCRSPNSSKEPCITGVLPKEILENKDCLAEANKDKICLHCDAQDELNANLPEHVTLRCEEKTVGDLVLETITETVGNVWSGAGSLFSNLFIYGAIFLVIIIVLVVVINLIR